MKHSLNIKAIALAAVLAAACSGQYAGVPRAEALSFQTERSYGSLHRLSMAYANRLNAALKADTLHPGLYADYGVTLALMGYRNDANRMLNCEVKSFPESRGQVRRIKQQLMPEFLGDTTADFRESADIHRLEERAYSKADARKRLPKVASVIDSTDTEWVMRQTPVDSVQVPVRLSANQKRELVAQMERQKVLQKKAAEDSVAAVKQARIDARKQKQVDKAKAKKEKAKAKKQAAKEKKKAAKAKKKASKSRR